MNNASYKTFGARLKEIRSKAKESIFDVCGAVEADESLIKNIEAGKEQPTEDLVLLLISHFALKDDDALSLWELAGYEQSKTGMSSISTESGDSVTQKSYVTSGDVRVLYTDMVHIKANNHGVVLNFLQSLGADDHTVAVSRVGMSLEHAESLLGVLQQTIKESKKSQKPTSRQPKKPKK